MQVRPGDAAGLDVGFHQHELAIFRVRGIVCREDPLVDRVPHACLLRGVHHRLGLVGHGDIVSGQDVHAMDAAERRAQPRATTPLMNFASRLTTCFFGKESAGVPPAIVGLRFLGCDSR